MEPSFILVGLKGERSGIFYEYKMDVENNKTKTRQTPFDLNESTK